MTSESSSAILDLNDVDTEDTEPPSITDDGRDGAPLIMDHGYDIAVKVDAPMKQLSTLETFVTYRVRCACARWPTPSHVRRRYNHFKLLHKRLSTQGWVAPPPLPPLHTARQQLDRYCAAFVALRTHALHSFLDRVAKHPIFSHSEDFRLFVTTPDEEFEKVFKSENSALNLWGLSSALYGSGETKPPANSARVKDPEWCAHAEYLGSLQHKLTTLCTLTNKLHKGTIAVAAEWMNMKRACDAWSSQARGAAGRGAGAVGAGAGVAARPPPLLPRTDRALLPMLAAYTGAHLDKIRQRDQLHAAYVSGTAAPGETHNKLEQCTEALRSELSDWVPKTRGELRALLLELAHAQVAHHAHVAAGWERALALTQDANVEELFKTVSKNAVQNLSPSRCRAELTPTETERDLEDLENDSNDSESFIERTNERESEQLSERVSELLSERMSEVVSEEKNETNHILKDPLNINSVVKAQQKNDSLSEILDDTEPSGSKDDKEVKDSTSLEQSLKSDVVSDPLREFSDVDLS